MLKKITFTLTAIFLFGIVFLIAINSSILLIGKKHIINENNNNKYDAIIVLGASVYKNQTPSPMLKDRLDKSIELYNKGFSSKIIMSGDHSGDDYDEVTIMKNYAIGKNIASSGIYLDHYGIETYASMYNMKNVFNLKKVLIVTQEYHLYRAIYIARSLGLEADGVPAEDIKYVGQTKRNIREIGARIKAFFTTKIRREVNYTGEEIDLSKSGDLTNNRK